MVISFEILITLCIIVILAVGVGALIPLLRSARIRTLLIEREQQVKALQVELQSSQTYNSKVEEQNRSLDTNLQLLNARLENTHGELKSIQEQRASLDVECRELNASNRALSGRLEGVQAVLDERSSALDKAHRDNIELKEHAREQGEYASLIQAKVQGLTSSLEGLQTALDERSTTLKSVQRDYAELQVKSREEAEQKSAAQGRAQEVEKLFRVLKEQSGMQAIELERARETLADQRTKYAELSVSLDEREKSYERQVESFEEQKRLLAEQFKLMANDILEAKTKTLQENSKESLSAVMHPFQKFMDDFKKEVHDIHHRETTQQGELRQELSALKELNQQITQEAHELSTALRGQKKLQGNWGELILENVLDRSGLQLGLDYRREVSFNTDEGRQRPDAIVYLPQDKHLIIDAKVSLSAYTRFVNAEDDVTRNEALKSHVQAFRDRITELADRDYDKLEELNSPEVVFMFVPIESAFIEALKGDEELFQMAIQRNILVATPTTLLTSLNIVRQLWRFEDQNKHTAALAHKADLVFRKLNTFLSSFENIRKSIDRASDAYMKAENQLVSGRGNLVKQVSDFKQLAPAIKAELPSYFTDKADLEIDLVAPDFLE